MGRNTDIVWQALISGLFEPYTSGVEMQGSPDNGEQLEARPA